MIFSMMLSWWGLGLAWRALAALRWLDLVVAMLRSVRASARCEATFVETVMCGWVLAGLNVSAAPPRRCSVLTVTVLGGRGTKRNGCGF
jgi:hypothetical protein